MHTMGREQQLVAACLKICFSCSGKVIHHQIAFVLASRANLIFRAPPPSLCGGKGGGSESSRRKDKGKGGHCWNKGILIGPAHLDKQYNFSPEMLSKCSICD
ncbi:hypothetical protein CEXT_632951 [Caerostris extrusa]|uniref:Uncharacterized protein n=1 Tax=Caerostris extrusa TaxID=172846 RepID=A0AAV4MZ45_CAEEX|nr:hypothetical protein CEXT_632951 [Caerostris extrusa]